MSTPSMNGLYKALSGNGISCISGPSDVRTHLALISAAKYLKRSEECQVLWVNGDSLFDVVNASQILCNGGGGDDDNTNSVLDRFRILNVFDTHELVQELVMIQTKQEISDCMVIINSISNLIFEYAARSGLSSAGFEHLDSVSRTISCCPYTLILDNAIDPSLVDADNNNEFATLLNTSDLAPFIMGPPVQASSQASLPPSCPLTGRRPLCQCIDDAVDLSLVITPRNDQDSPRPIYITSVCKHRNGDLGGIFWLLRYDTKDEMSSGTTIDGNLACIATNCANDD